MAETLGSKAVSTKIERIAKLARELPNRPLTTLAHHIVRAAVGESPSRLLKKSTRVDNEPSP